VQRFMYEQFQELEQTVTSQREEAAQSIEIRHYLCDHLGTPHALIGEDTQLEWAVQLDAWGNVRAEHNPSGEYQPIRLPGQHADEDTGLYYNRYRYYEPDIAGFINQDPLGINASINLDKYVKNPLQWVDVLGLEGWASIPIFNGNLPGNQAALTNAMNLTNCGQCLSDKESVFSRENLRKFGIPTSKLEAADYLAKQSDYFGAASIALAYFPPLAAAAPVAGAIGAAADAGSKILKPTPNIIHLNDAVLDIAGAHAPGGFIKDIGFIVLKKIMTTAVEMAPSAVAGPSEKSCGTSNL
ncbi:RHS repeat-associated core domain-containing protein, partial [Comamonas sp. MYb21]|uniref:RHS repeat-associated core domain-containing protein n=1 Tax=Comamonas sp. MYb21 TaxID=1848648 RepID=UPI00309920B1